MLLQRVIKAPRSVVCGAPLNPETLPRMVGSRRLLLSDEAINLGRRRMGLRHDRPDGTVPSRTTAATRGPADRAGSPMRCTGARTRPHKARRRPGPPSRKRRGNEGHAGHGVQHASRIPGREVGAVELAADPGQTRALHQSRVKPHLPRICVRASSNTTRANVGAGPPPAATKHPPLTVSTAFSSQCPLRGYGVMVAPQPSKLVVRVRFPLPAPSSPYRLHRRAGT